MQIELDVLSCQFGKMENGHEWANLTYLDGQYFERNNADGSAFGKQTSKVQISSDNNNMVAREIVQAKMVGKTAFKVETMIKGGSTTFKIVDLVRAKS